LGGLCYTFDTESKVWKQIYDEALSEAERAEIISAFDYAMAKSGVDLSNPFGQIIEDRETQITFSGRGQDAPADVKASWDIERTKRAKIVELLREKIPQYEFHVNGSSSIDVTRVGLP
jgi:uncharacterized protein YajQ (UPF0234 family)